MTADAPNPAAELALQLRDIAADALVLVRELQTNLILLDDINRNGRLFNQEKIRYGLGRDCQAQLARLYPLLNGVPGRLSYLDAAVLRLQVAAAAAYDLALWADRMRPAVIQLVDALQVLHRGPMAYPVTQSGHNHSAHLLREAAEGNDDPYWRAVRLGGRTLTERGYGDAWMVGVYPSGTSLWRIACASFLTATVDSQGAFRLDLG